jgi:hypothetical protein
MSSFHHIHMMEVLVRCCCPQLPALPLPLPTPSDVQSPVGVVALNEGECPQEAVQLTDLCAFSEKLLTNLLSLIKGQFQPDTQIAQCSAGTHILYTCTTLGPPHTVEHTQAHQIHRARSAD